jgi:hypothetical protein
LPRRADPAGVAKAKGATLVGAVRWLRTDREAARKQLPPHLHHYLVNRIQIASWYPEEDLLALIRALGAILPDQGRDVFEQMGRFSARDQFAGVYRHLLEGGDEFSLPRRGLVLWESQHDSGRLEVTLGKPGSAQVEVIDYALPSVEMCKILLGYTVEMLVMAELKDPEVTQTACRVDGDERCSWRCRWTPRAVVPSTSDR